MSTEAIYVQVGKVAKRYSVCTRTLDRWLKDRRTNFPPPVAIRGVRYWTLSDLEQWERANAARIAGNLEE
jgi:predicted DNA-binding transcriptional regulator AlpA